ncbi:hypothetical protein RvY_08601 [Ramazzottius varieornatus]|uniref:Cyclic nucleotide-binding domain-containing protein n=1 Tax=Ramazzottius varieornatus TaxID=947166 RepID=A0A1D1V913_RAMVA|nr:hypothetical protein RvY_08601 [Ramazzottius varieornatus]
MKMPKIPSAFLVHPGLRTEQDLDEIYDFLRSISTLHSISDQEVANMCGRVRHEHHEAEEVLFCRDEPAASWYILLTGATFIDGTMFLPYHW